MDEVDTLGTDEPAQPGDPTEPPPAFETVDGQPCSLELRDECALPRKKIGDAVIELRPTQVGGGVDEQLLRTTPPQAFDEYQDAADDLLPVIRSCHPKDGDGHQRDRDEVQRVVHTCMYPKSAPARSCDRPHAPRPARHIEPSESPRR